MQQSANNSTWVLHDRSPTFVFLYENQFILFVPLALASLLDIHLAYNNGCKKVVVLCWFFALRLISCLQSLTKALELLLKLEAPPTAELLQLQAPPTAQLLHNFASRRKADPNAEEFVVVFCLCVSARIFCLLLLLLSILTLNLTCVKR